MLTSDIPKILDEEHGSVHHKYDILVSADTNIPENAEFARSKIASEIHFSTTGVVDMESSIPKSLRDDQNNPQADVIAEDIPVPIPLEIGVDILSLDDWYDTAEVGSPELLDSPNRVNHKNGDEVVIKRDDAENDHVNTLGEMFLEKEISSKLGETSCLPDQCQS